MTRSVWVAATVLGVSLVALGAVARMRPVVVWNASPSVPVGLYAVAPAHALVVGELVVIRPPTALAVWLAGRRYLAPGVPLLKHVAALPGQRVCRIGHAILVGGAPSGMALDRDRRGRPLPVWSGCQVVSPAGGVPDERRAGLSRQPLLRPLCRTPRSSAARCRFGRRGGRERV